MYKERGKKGQSDSEIDVRNQRVQELAKSFEVALNNRNYRPVRLQSAREIFRSYTRDQPDDVAFDHSSGQIFVLFKDITEVFNLEMNKLYSFTLENKNAGFPGKIAFGGCGTLYVNYIQGHQVVTSTVDKKTGKISRNIHTDNDGFNWIETHGNRLVTINSSTDQFYVYDDEKLSKTMEIQGKIYLSTKIVGYDYLVYLRSVNNSAQLVISSILNIENGEKIVHLSGVVDMYSNFVWIPKSSNSAAAEGYIFVTCCDSAPEKPGSCFLFSFTLCKGVKKTVPKPVVYNVHLAEVEDGAKLEPLNIPFIFKENYDEILILSDVGCDSILCCDFTTVNPTSQDGGSWIPPNVEPTEYELIMLEVDDILLSPSTPLVLPPLVPKLVSGMPMLAVFTMAQATV
ncbi:uncharacterized protein LOC142352851 [Convolutriloba macropyga]|uniref:uncharacterized protein LOC142352851 n=1 Tax=Convolutriloba macropyga TaxID=536237 RepID=UPI003F528FCC